MNSVQIKTADVLTALQANLQKHTTEYDQALAGWKELCAEKYAQAATDVRSGKDVDPNELAKDLQKPMDYRQTYQEAIEMLQMEVREIIELGSIDFRQYVKDDWSWKKTWSVSNVKYTDRVLSAHRTS